MELDRAGENVGGQVSDEFLHDADARPNGSSDLDKDSVVDGQAVRPHCLVAAVAGASAIMIGAFGAHGLQTYLPDTGIDAETVQRRLDQFDTGARYHLAHAIVLLVLAVARFRPTRIFRTAFALFVAGIVFFSGSLYALVLTNTPVMGAITPIGGASWIVAWCLVGFCRR